MRARLHARPWACSGAALTCRCVLLLLLLLLLQSLAQLYDTASGLGSNFHELVHGVDCPFHASYLDAAAFVDRDAPLYHPQSICVWEQDTGRPLRRHYTQVRAPPPLAAAWGHACPFILAGSQQVWRGLP